MMEVAEGLGACGATKWSREARAPTLRGGRARYNGKTGRDRICGTLNIQPKNAGCSGGDVLGEAEVFFNGADAVTQGVEFFGVAAHVGHICFEFVQMHVDVDEFAFYV